jgi:phage terminase large subunit-like protein
LTASLAADASRPLSRLERLVYERQLRDLQHGHERGLVWDEDEAQRVVQFFALLTHWKGKFARKPIHLDGWQREALICPLLAWKLADGMRRFRTAYIEIPRKNGKTTITAGIGLWGLMADREPGAEIYLAATKRDQANIMFKDCKALVRGSDALRKRLKLQSHVISYPELNGFLKPISADANSADGFNLHMGLLDEVHKHKSRDLYDVLYTASGAREQPLIVAITTAGYDRTSLCWELHDYSVKVLAGEIEDDSHFAFLACADDDAPWDDPATWSMANPGLHASVSADYLKTLALKAKASPSFENTFRRLHLNQWTEQENRWLRMDHWAAASASYIPEDLRGQPCWAGVDLSKTSDTTAVVLVFPRRDVIWLLPYCWIPGDTALRHAREDNVPYEAWARHGHIGLTDGDVVDYDVILEHLLALQKVYDLREVAIDPWNASYFAKRAMEAGLPIVEFGQSLRNMSEPSTEFERRLVAGLVRHPGNPVFDWQAGNVSIKRNPDGLIKPVKPKDARKIDLIAATIMGLGRALAAPKDTQSVYETRGFRWM